MPGLADLQGSVRASLLTGDTAAVAPVLVGGHDGRKRLTVHQRHYSASLMRVLLDRFPATVWLVGSEFVENAAGQFVRHHPPTRPCIAEYGEEFPAFLGAQPRADATPYLAQFALLEWHLGRLSVAVDLPGPTAADLAAFNGDALANATIALQPGVQLLHLDRAVDELMALYLSDKAPDQFTLECGDVWLQLRGCRGELTMTRLTRADFFFRAALVNGQLLGDAALSGIDVDPAFDAGRALLDLLAEDLVVTIDVRLPEDAQ
jgi:hypothetical protein